MSFKSISAALLASAIALSAGVAQAALQDRGGGLLYDDVLNVTWLQDANYAKTSGYDSDGLMTWNQANTWASNLSYYDSIRGVNYSDWRLANSSKVNGIYWDERFFTNGSTDVGYNITGSFSELSHMYYVNLGLKGYYDFSGSPQPDYGIFGNGTYNGTDQNSFGQNDVGLVQNIQSYVYWSGTSRDSRAVWVFNTINGDQYASGKSYDFYAWAVRDGDVAPIPEPETYAMMLTGLGLISFMTRRKAAS